MNLRLLLGTIAFLVLVLIGALLILCLTKPSKEPSIEGTITTPYLPAPKKKPPMPLPPVPPSPK